MLWIKNTFSLVFFLRHVKKNVQNNSYKKMSVLLHSPGGGWNWPSFINVSYSYILHLKDLFFFLWFFASIFLIGFRPFHNFFNNRLINCFHAKQWNLYVWFLCHRPIDHMWNKVLLMQNPTNSIISHMNFEIFIFAINFMKVGLSVISQDVKNLKFRYKFLNLKLSLTHPTITTQSSKINPSLLN